MITLMLPFLGSLESFIASSAFSNGKRCVTNGFTSMIPSLISLITGGHDWWYLFMNLTSISAKESFMNGKLLNVGLPTPITVMEPPLLATSIWYVLTLGISFFANSNLSAERSEMTSGEAPLALAITKVANPIGPAPQIIAPLPSSNSALSTPW
ncbi:hypothetical protein OGAPHI_003166 [Ogataea philodendri]|uniref:Uncharacterized protein n=1 Tax=Ogataea philodendri TaxID=1378263 RepID=A0A9P8P8W1_9ASCO|nr:uncharacterized protein OGAPHI_003166 [Ogataea philodendri]KAH3667517.1 hypothetical protein OGAPHI_003166 [Ogataea philodendri]